MLFLLCDVIQNKVIRKENFSWLDVCFGRPKLFKQVKCLNNLNVENGTGVYLIQVKEKRKSRSKKVGVFFFKQTVDIFVRNFSEFAHMVILSLMLFLIFTE